MTTQNLEARGFFVDVSQGEATSRYYAGVVFRSGGAASKVNFSEFTERSAHTFALHFHPAALSLHSYEHLCRVAIAQAFRDNLFKRREGHEEHALDLSIKAWELALEPAA